MITLASHAALAASLFLAPPLAAAQRITAPVPRAPLTSLVSRDDYPQQARADRAQGTVRFRLVVETDGRVSRCTILRSSGSSILDSTTCRLMRSRARFVPARDASGRFVSGQVEDEISWTPGASPVPVLSAAIPPPRFYTLVSIYTACAMGDAARRAISTLDVGAIPDAAYATCVEIEPLLLAEMARANLPNMVPADAMRQLKLRLRTRLVAQVGTMRGNLAARSMK